MTVYILSMNPNRSLLKLLAAAMLAAIVTLGCGGSTDGEVEDIEVAAQTMNDYFSDADPAAQQAANQAAEAMRTQKHDQAYQSLISLQKRQDLSPEQGMIAHQSMKSLRYQIALRASQGDTNAQALARIINRSMTY